MPSTSVSFANTSMLIAASSFVLLISLTTTLLLFAICEDAVLALNELPATSVPVTVASKVVWFNKSAPLTEMLKVLSLATNPLYALPLMVKLTRLP